MSDNNNSAGIAFLSFLVGVLFGGVIALLYAPKTGMELRTQIRDTATETSHQLAEQYDKSLKTVQKSLADTQAQLADLMKKEGTVEAEVSEVAEEEAAA
ncbi:MAG: YtxH domain-containing protein [Anaerolineales bacterium]|nr:YtxH domain-containing protein [Anaerolineales bacterium]